jgi:hypothetical protein
MDTDPRAREWAREWAKEWVAKEWVAPEWAVITEVEA